jgi:hypothetical protein
MSRFWNNEKNWDLIILQIVIAILICLGLWENIS